MAQTEYEKIWTEGYNTGYRSALETAKRLKKRPYRDIDSEIYAKRKAKRKLSGWQKFIKANSKKPRFKLRSGKLNLKKMGVAYRKTAAYKRSKK